MMKTIFASKIESSVNRKKRHESTCIMRIIQLLRWGHMDKFGGPGLY